MKCIATAARWFAKFLLNPLVRRVKRRIPILIVRFWRSMCDVLMCFVSGRPLIRTISVPTHSRGLC